VSACAQKISDFGMLNNGKVKNKSACAQQNADLLKKFSLIRTQVNWYFYPSFSLVF